MARMAQLVQEGAGALEVAVVGDPDSGSAWSGGNSPAMLLAYIRCTLVGTPAWLSRSAHNVAIAMFGAG